MPIPKKSDFLLIAFSIATIALAILALFRTFNGNERTQMEIKEELQLVGVINEFDCVECIRKVICYWHILERDFQEQGIGVRLIFIVEDAENFNREELKLLCDLPDTFEETSHEDLPNAELSLLSTPSITLTDGNRSLQIEPIFLRSDMESLHQAFLQNLADFLPQARVIRH